MKKFTKLLSVLVALVMSFSIFALAACDETPADNSSTTDSTGENSSDAKDTTDSSSPSSDEDDSSQDSSGSSMLSAALLAAVNDIYTSTTGYQFDIDVNYTMTDSDNVATGAGVDATILTQNDGENFNADAEAYLSVTNADYDAATGTAETYTEYTYLSALLRGTDLYATYTETNEEGMTDEEKADLAYDCTDLAELVTYLSSDDTVNSYLSLYQDGAYDGVISTISAFAANILAGMTGTIGTVFVSTGSSGSYYIELSLTYDIDDVLLEYVTAVDSVLELIAASSGLSDSYTVNDLLSNTVVQALLTQILDGMTGEDIYEVANFVYEIVNTISETTETTDTTDTTGTAETPAISIPEATEGQSAYEYIMTFVTANGLGSVALNSKAVLSYISKAQDVTGTIMGVLEDATIEAKFILDYGSYSLSGISFDVHNLAISGYAIDLDVDISMEEKEVTLTDISGISYSKTITNYGDDFYIYGGEGVVTYYTYIKINYDGSIYLGGGYDINELADESAYDYIDANGNYYKYTDGEVFGYTVTYTTDENGAIETVTLTDTETEETATYNVTDGSITLNFYDNVIEITVPLW